MSTQDKGELKLRSSEVPLASGTQAIVKKATTHFTRS